jgi:hypothetical protein
MYANPFHNIKTTDRKLNTLFKNTFLKLKYMEFHVHTLGWLFVNLHK